MNSQKRRTEGDDKQMKTVLTVLAICVGLSGCYRPILNQTEQERVEEYNRLQIMREQREIGRILRRELYR